MTTTTVPTFDILDYAASIFRIPAPAPVPVVIDFPEVNEVDTCGKRKNQIQV